MQFNNLVVLDANFILAPVQFKVDYLEQINFKLHGTTRFLIFKQIFDELKAKANRFERQKKSAQFESQLKAGKSYLKHNKSKYHIQYSNTVKNGTETTDEFLLRKVITLKKKYDHVYLATNDKNLRRKARIHVSVILIRQGKKIAII